MKRHAALAGSMAAFIPRLGREQAFPDHPMRFVVPHVSGGSTDTSTRRWPTPRSAATELNAGAQPEARGRSRVDDNRCRPLERTCGPL